MEKNLYIDATHPNETRVVLKSDDNIEDYEYEGCLLYTSPSPRDGLLSRMPSSA